MGIYKNTKIKSKLRKKTKKKLNSISNSKFRNKSIVGGSGTSKQSKIYSGQPASSFKIINPSSQPKYETSFSKKYERATSGNIAKTALSRAVRAPLAGSVGLGVGVASVGLRAATGVVAAPVIGLMAGIRGARQHMAKRSLNKALGLKTDTFWSRNNNRIAAFRKASNTYIKEKEKDLKKISKLEKKITSNPNIKLINNLEELKKSRNTKNQTFQTAKTTLQSSFPGLGENFGSTVKELRKVLLDKTIANQQEQQNKVKAARAKYDNALSTGKNINSAKTELNNAKATFKGLYGNKSNNVIALSKHLNERKEKFQKTPTSILNPLKMITSAFDNAKEAAKISFETQKLGKIETNGDIGKIVLQPLKLITSPLQGLYGVTLGKLIKSKPSTLDLATSYDSELKQIANIKATAFENKKVYISLKAGFKYKLDQPGNGNIELSNIYNKINDIDTKRENLENSYYNIKVLKQKINNDPTQKSLYEAQLLQEERNFNKLENDIGILESDIDYNLKISNDAPLKESLVNLFNGNKTIASQKQEIRNIDSINEQKKLLLEEKFRRDIEKINNIIGDNETTTLMGVKINEIYSNPNSRSNIDLSYSNVIQNPKAFQDSKAIKDDKQYEIIIKNMHEFKEKWKTEKKHELSSDEYNKILDYVEAQLNLYIQSKVGIYGQSQV